MKTIIVNNQVMNITSINNIDSDQIDQETALLEGKSNNHFNNVKEIQAFVDGCDEINAYFTKHNVQEEFNSYLNLKNAKLIDENTIEINGEII